MKLTNYVAAATLLLSAVSVMGQGTLPSEAPQVTVGADIKMLIFDWAPVPGATYYQLYVNVDGHSGYSKTGPRIAAPGTRAGYGISAHLQHWQDALYKVSACNAAGCRDSKSLFPRRHMLETIGYFKASNTDPHDGFGYSIALSGDGITMAVTAEGEASKATGINGDQSDNSLVESGAVYVFRKVSGKWRQEAYLKVPQNNHDYRHFGSSLLGYGMHTLGLTNDGNSLVVGALENDGSAAGEVVTYIRASNGSWSTQSRLTAPDATVSDAFGDTVDISGDGQTLRVGTFHSADVTATAKGTTYLYVRSASGWQFVQKLVANHPGYNCVMSRLSRDASTLVQYCFKPNYSGAHLETYRRSGNTWSHVSDFDQTAGEPQQPALSDDGNALAIRLPVRNGNFYSHNVRAFRWVNSTWVQEKTFAAPATLDNGFSDWGSAISFNSNGSFLAIGDSYVEPPGPPGVSEEITTGTAGYGGAVFIYQRTAGAATPWSFRSQVLAPNLATSSGFGTSAALSGTGATLAVGAIGDSSKAKGINGDQTDDSAPSAGAAYLY